MKRKTVTLLSLLILVPLTTLGQESNIYQKRIEKHSQSGHLTQEELSIQKFNYNNQKKWHKSFSKKVRSVASTLDESRDIIRLKNEDIEINIK